MNAGQAAFHFVFSRGHQIKAKKAVADKTQPGRVENLLQTLKKKFEIKLSNSVFTSGQD